MGAATRRFEQMNVTPGRVIAAIAILVAGGGYYYWQHRDTNTLPAGFARGNGRIEAVEIDIATKTPGRIREILVGEGDFVRAGQVLARMDTEQLQAQHRAAINVETAKNLVNQREAERKAAEAVVDQRVAQLDTTSRKLDRSEQLIQDECGVAAGSGRRPLRQRHGKGGARRVARSGRSIGSGDQLRPRHGDRRRRRGRRCEGRDREHQCRPQ
jgi:multidrug resistance efflux pump